ncbi:MAG: glycosyltransferase family 4 protein [Patescibacteria group bacterium]|nr:glycosyltransferase family 4 protein [Patescibacteria group bacterium]
MIIAIDGYEANVEKRVGIGQYAYQILAHLHHLLSKRGDISVRVYVPEDPRSDMPKSSDHWMYIVRKPKKLWTFCALPFSIALDRPSANVVFSPTHYIPRFVSTSRVFSLMDLSFLFFPDLFRKKDYYQLTQWTQYSIHHARAIFTISESSRNAIIEQYHYPTERIFVTYPGFSMNRKHKKSDRTSQIPYILSVGTLQPRKNYEKLIEAFSLLKDKSLELIIVGKKGWLFESILEAPKKFDVQDRVRFLDFVPDDELPELYAHARCFALVSLYEGFGLPVLEAMAYSCPVVVSNVSSLPEIAGDAGIYVNPESVESIANGLQKALTEDNTERKKKGLERVKMFSWEKAARKTLDVLEKVGTGVL